MVYTVCDIVEQSTPLQSAVELGGLLHLIAISLYVKIFLNWSTLSSELKSF